MTTSNLTQICELVLDACKAKNDEKIILLTSESFDEEVLSAYSAALTRREADYVRMILPSRFRSGKYLSPAGPTAMKMIENADLVIDIVSKFPTWQINIDLYSDEFYKILQFGCRWQTVTISNPEVNLPRLAPSSETVRLSHEGARKMQNARRIKITSPKGTDLTFDKEGRKGSHQGLGASEPGRWDNFGWFLISTAPIEDSANGVIVADSNDAILGIGDSTIFLEEPTAFEIKDGLIIRVSGGLTARRISRFLESHDKETAGVAHASWGTQTGSVWSESPIVTYADVEGFLGGVTIHFGTNIYDCPAKHCGLGGKRRADLHWGGITSLQNDFDLDGELVVKNGRVMY